MTFSFKSSSILSFAFLFSILSCAQQASEKAAPIFKDGEAQIVEAFSNSDEWIRHDLWVETEFDTDGDGEPDRMHVSVTRPEQRETEKGKRPIG